MVSGFQSVTRNHCLISNFVLWIRRGRSVEKEKKILVLIMTIKSLLLLLLLYCYHCYIYTNLYIFVQPICFPFLEQRVLRTVKFPLNGPYIQYLTRNRHFDSDIHDVLLFTSSSRQGTRFNDPNVSNAIHWQLRVVFRYLQMNEQTNKWMNEWMNEWMNDEWMNEQTNERMNE